MICIFIKQNAAPGPFVLVLTCKNNENLQYRQKKMAAVSFRTTAILFRIIVSVHANEPAVGIESEINAVAETYLIAEAAPTHLGDKFRGIVSGNIIVHSLRHKFVRNGYADGGIDLGPLSGSVEFHLGAGRKAHFIVVVGTPGILNYAYRSLAGKIGGEEAACARRQTVVFEILVLVIVIGAGGAGGKNGESHEKNRKDLLYCLHYIYLS